MQYVIFFVLFHWSPAACRTGIYRYRQNVNTSERPPNGDGMSMFLANPCQVLHTEAKLKLDLSRSKLKIEPGRFIIRFECKT